MKCEICHQNDAQQPIIVKNDNGVAKELYVCKTCASQFNVGQIGKYSMADVLFDFSSTKKDKEIDPPKIEQVCPTCGATFAAIHRDHRAGCPDCYVAFEEQLDRLVALYNMSDVDIVNQEVDTLKQKLDAAITDERFEEAAVIRDLINTKTKAKSLNPITNENEKPDLPPELLDVMKKMGIDINDISNNRSSSREDPFDSEDDSSSDNDPF